jgi:hypothetical protein
MEPRHGAPRDAKATGAKVGPFRAVLRGIAITPATRGKNAADKIGLVQKQIVICNHDRPLDPSRIKLSGNFRVAEDNAKLQVNPLVAKETPLDPQSQLQTASIRRHTIGEGSWHECSLCKKQPLWTHA